MLAWPGIIHVHEAGSSRLQFCTGSTGMCDSKVHLLARSIQTLLIASLVSVQRWCSAGVKLSFQAPSKLA